MLQFFSDAWVFQYALLPCFCAYIVFDLPIIIRRITRKAYVPIYFAFFPIGYSDELLAKYFDEDEFFVVGGPFPQELRKSARRKIIIKSVLSLVLTMTISPLLTGVFATYVLSGAQFTQFLWTLSILKAVFLLWAFYDIRYSFRVSHRVPLPLLALVYTLYWVALVYFTVTFHEWVQVQNAQGGFVQVGRGILDFIIFDMGFSILFAAVVGLFVVWWLTNDEQGSDA